MQTRSKKSTTRSAKKPDDMNQSKAFVEKARELGCDESEEKFDKALRIIAKQKPHKPEPKREVKSKRQTPAK